MELRHLRYFVGVADHLSFRSAAEALHVSPTALTGQIRDLEEELGIKLLDRDTRGVSGLTLAGKTFLQDARHILSCADSASARARAYSAEADTRLSIGNIGILSASYLAPNLAVFRARHPDVTVNLAGLSMAEHTPALQNRLIDVGFTMGPRKPFPPEITQIPLFRSDLTVFLSESHPLASQPRIALEALVKETFVALQPKPHLRLHHEQICELFGRHGHALGATRFIDSYEGVFVMVASGNGFTCFPDFIVPAPIPGVVTRGLLPISEHWTSVFSALTRSEPQSLPVKQFLTVLAQRGGRATL